MYYENSFCNWADGEDPWKSKHSFPHVLMQYDVWEWNLKFQNQNSEKKAKIQNWNYPELSYNTIK